MANKDKMINLTSLTSFEVPNKGKVFIVNNPMKFKKDDCYFISSKVKIDKKVYTVIGVEAPCMNIIKAGTKIGLLVKD